MLETRTAEANRAAFVNEDGSGVQRNVPWYVTRVQSLPDFRLSVRFIDGTTGSIEMRKLIFSEQAGVFRALRDPVAFADVKVNDGVVTWANGLDIAPDASYGEIKQNGVQICDANHD